MAMQKVLLGNIKGDPGLNVITRQTKTEGFMAGDTLVVSEDNTVSGKKMTAADVKALAEDGKAADSAKFDGHMWEDVIPRAVTAVIDASGDISMTGDVAQIPVKIQYQSHDAGFTVIGGQIVVPKSGFVMVAMQAMFSAGIENAYVGVSARKNGRLAADYYEAYGVKGYGCIAGMPRIVQVEAGDKIALHTMKETGVNGVKVANSTRTGMTIQYV